MVGLLIALGLPALATFRAGFDDTTAAIALAATPWLVLLWTRLVEGRPLSDLGLVRPRWRSVLIGLVGAGVNAAISAGITLWFARAGLAETQSPLMGRLLSGPGPLLVVMVTNGALLTEISFRAYAIERLRALLGGGWRAGLAQVTITTAIFVIGRGWVHGAVWFVDDLVFTWFYLKTRDTVACVVAHGLPNLLASLLVALGRAS